MIQTLKKRRSPLEGSFWLCCDDTPHLVLHYACRPSCDATPHLVLHYVCHPSRDATAPHLVLHYACRPSRDATSQLVLHCTTRAALPVMPHPTPFHSRPRPSSPSAPLSATCATPLKTLNLFLFSIKPPQANSSLTFDFYIAVLAWKGSFSVLPHPTSSCTTRVLPFT